MIVFELLLLAVVLAGFGLMLAPLQNRRVVFLLVLFIIGPFLARLILCQFALMVGGLSAAQQFVLFALLAFASWVVISVIFPKTSWIRRATGFVLDLSAFVFTLPFRFLWRCFRLVRQRERYRIDLAEIPVVVGRRPQLHQTDRDHGISEDNP